MANFELPPVNNDNSPQVESFEESELASMASTGLLALSNAMSSVKADLSMKFAQIKNRAQKLSGESSIAVPGKGRNSVESTASVTNIKTSLESLIGPAASIAALVSMSASKGDTILNNPVGSGGEGGAGEPDSPDSGADDDDAAAAAGKVTALVGVAGLAGLSLLDSSEIAILTAGASQLQVAAQTVEDNLAKIQSVLQKRADGILAEPELNLEPFASTDPAIVKIADDYATFITNNIVAPFVENQDRFERLSQQTQLLLSDDDAPLFDFTYGPPVSVKGQFILSDDGLYYDVVNGGIPIVSGITAASSTWNLSYAPNIGGKGEIYTQENLDLLSDTIFSLDYNPDNNIADLYYNSDDVLETFEKDKIMHTTLIYDQIADLTASGYSNDSAIVINYYSNIAALAGMYDEKINKRKKQLQLVSIFASDKYSFTESTGAVGVNPKNLGLGPGVLIENRSDISNIKDDWHPIERIPLNDFSFLKGKGLNVSLENQEKILLFSEDLEDVVLPIVPVFVKSPSQSTSVIRDFSLPPVNPETFPHYEGDSNVSATGSLVNSLTTSIITDGLILGYNFITPNVVDASSNKFNLDNIVADSGGQLDGQLVGSSIDNVFPSGLSIPKLTGVNPTASGGGSYVRLPSRFKPDGSDYGTTTKLLDGLFYIENFTYNEDTKRGGGVTFDFWTHVPDLTMTDSHRYKLIAACENSGGDPNTGPVEGEINAKRTRSSGLRDERKVHGMLIGFRDKGGSTTPSGLEFGVYPTVSQNSKLGKYGHSIAIAESITYAPSSLEVSTVTELGSSTASSVSVNGVSITDASSQFVHISVVFDFLTDTLNMYFDGELLSSASIRDSFDVQHNKYLEIPTFTMSGINPYVDSWSPSANAGPVVGNISNGMTPWILGGGFSDTITRSTYSGSLLGSYDPGFLGYNTNDYYTAPDNSQHTPNLGSGLATTPSSGLDGFLGSFKIYSRALSNKEVKRNFSYQKGFYKNIQV